MRVKLVAITLIVILSLVLSAAASSAQESEPVAPQEAQAPVGSSFTYQGQLNVEGLPASGTYDFEFRLFNAASGGGQVGGPVAVNDLQVQSGLFTVQLDFGAAAFNGQARWLQIRVRPGAGDGNYTILQPRQRLAPAPFALWSADGPFWKLRGNGGTTAADFLGTTDNAPLVFKVNDTVALRLVPAGGTPNLLGGWQENSATGVGATIAGGGGAGVPNRVTDDYGAIGGGASNLAGSDDNDPSTARYAVVGGGYTNRASGTSATVGGGDNNQAQGIITTVGGGSHNQAVADGATVGGGQFNVVTGGLATVGGGRDNGVTGIAATIAGGFFNGASGDYSSIGGGNRNLATAIYATIGGGGPTNEMNASNTNNRVLSAYGTVGGGGNNRAGNSALLDPSPFATVGGGESNRATGDHATVGGGGSNRANSDYATVGGGQRNHATGLFAIIPGGSDNTADGNHSFAAGFRAKANHTGTFVWADSENADMASTGDDQFIVRAAGGIFFQNDSTLDDQGGFINTSVGARLSNGGEWVNASDATLKENFAAVNGRQILAQLASVPIATWNYKAEDTSVRHIGPTAQDFAAAFGVGEDDRHIGTVDASGVALAAIQGLNQVVEEKDAEIASLKQDNESQQAQIEALEARLGALERAAGDNSLSGVRSLALWAPLLVGVALLALRRWSGREGDRT